MIPGAAPFKEWYSGPHPLQALGVLGEKISEPQLSSRQTFRSFPEAYKDPKPPHLVDALQTSGEAQ
jgi:hypothetical protein